MLFARQLIVNAAGAYGLQAIDLVNHMACSTFNTHINTLLNLTRSV